MYTDEYVKEMINAHRGFYLPKKTQTLIRFASSDNIICQIKGDLEEFDEEKREEIDSFTWRFLENNWLNLGYIENDLAFLIEDVISSAKCFGEAFEWGFSDGDCYKIYLIIFHKFAYCASVNKGLRKSINIKKGFFS